METKIINLFKKYIEGECSGPELEDILEILKKGSYHDEWEQVIADEARQVIASGVQSKLSVNEANAIYSRIALRLPSRIKKVYQLWSRIAAAAVILLIAGAGFFYLYDKNAVTSDAIYANDVAPGKIGATLTLSDGKRIKLTEAADGVLANEAGISIRKTTKGQIVYQMNQLRGGSDKLNTLTTARGETYLLILPDQSRVWMNAGSSLTYTASLESKGVRRVKLEGEAYFEIHKDKAHPFVVESKGQQLEVLGTHFNVNSYSDEPVVSTTLLEGSVKITAGLGAQQVLKPNQQSAVSDGAIHVEAAHIERTMAWKNGYFRFNDEKIETIMRQLSRWYAIDVMYDGKLPAEGFNGKVSRSKSISQVLKALESTKLVHFKIEGRRVTVMGE